MVVTPEDMQIIQGRTWEFATCYGNEVYLAGLVLKPVTSETKRDSFRIGLTEGLVGTEGYDHHQTFQVTHPLLTDLL